MSFLEAFEWYLLLGVFVQIIEHLNGWIFHREDFNEYIADMKEFSVGGQMILLIIEVVIWPWFLVSGVIGIFKKLLNKKSD